MRRKLIVSNSIQILLVITSFLLVIFNSREEEDIYCLNSNMLWAPAGCLFIIILGTIFEGFGYKHSIIKHLFVYSILFIILMSVPLGVEHSAFMLGMALSLYLLILIPYLIYFILTKRIVENTTLPRNFYSFKEAYIFGLIYTGVLIGLFTMSYYITLYGSIFTALALDIIIAGCLVCLYYFFVIKKKPENMIYDMILNAEEPIKVEAKIDDLLAKGPHPDNATYLLLLKVSYMLRYDVKQAKELFYTMSYPLSIRNKKLYTSVKCDIYFAEKNNLECIKVINTMTSREKEKALLCYKADMTIDEMPNVEEAFPINLEYKMDKYNSYLHRMRYYYLRNDKEKAIENANKLVVEARFFTEYVNEALGVIDVFKNTEMATT